jgi:hypothetical protein
MEAFKFNILETECESRGCNPKPLSEIPLATAVYTVATFAQLLDKN